MERLTPNSDDRTFGMLTHFSALLGFFFPFGSIIGPLVAWSLKKESSQFVDENGKSALNFNITWTIIVAILWILWMVQFFGSIPWLIIIENNGEFEGDFPLKMLLSSFLYLIPIGVIYLFKFLMMLIGTVKASSGDIFYYPLSYKFVK